MTQAHVPGPAVPAWQPPWEHSGDLMHVRVMSGRLTRSPLYSCPALEAKKARPGVYPVRDRKADVGIRPPHAEVAIGLVRDVVIDHVVRRQTPTPESIEQSSVRAAGARFVAPGTTLAVQAGVAGYRAVLQRLRAEGQLAVAAVLVPDVVVTDAQVGGGVVEWAAWGLHWIDADGVRESHLPVWSAAGSRPRPDAVLGVAARAGAEGFRAAPLGSWPQRHQPDSVQPPPVTRVRVREVGVLDGSDAVLFDGTAEQARALFDAAVPPALPVLAGEAYQPGRGCVGCPIRLECPALVRAPGVLGVAGRADYTRALSTSDLWMHELCPQQAHLSGDLGLPREPVPELEAARRGILVHAWLEAAHGRGIRCTAGDLPEGTNPGALGTELGWGPQEAALTAPYLAWHPDQCPVSGATGELAVPECAITVHDTDTDVVLTTRPDLVVAHHDGDGRRTLVVRETKTLNLRRLEPDEELGLLHRFPQVAAAVCVLAEGVDPIEPLQRIDPAGSRVELELLGADGATVIAFELDDPMVVLQARVALAQRVDVWLHDQAHQPRPGRHCERCPVRRWCPVTVLAEQGLAVAGLDDEPSVPGWADQPESVPLDVLALIEADAGSVGGEEFPF